MHIDADLLSSALSLDLYEAGWDGCLNPYPGQTIRQFAMSHLHKSLVKKYLPGTSDRNPNGDLKAMEKFVQINNSCRDWFLDQSSFTDLEAVALGEFRVQLDSFFFPDWGCSKIPASLLEGKEEGVWVEEQFQGPILSHDKIAMGFGLGNGANIGARDTDLYSKLAASDMSATSLDLHKLYVHAIRNSPTWTEMEHSRSKMLGYRTVESSRLSFVPKTTEVSRTICTEPILNMLYQKGIASVLEKRLCQVYGIDLSTQPEKNSEYARVGSITGKFGTIDLSSASDSMSINFCKEFLPAQALNWLMLTRTPSTVLPDGKKMDLHMISSMGNAFTFPLQTIVFCAIVCSCYRAYGVQPVSPRGSGVSGNYAVFGDDIIVLDKVYNLVCRMLNAFGFTVNADKSFNEGLFRESCGSDFLAGHNVRGVYIKSLRDMSDCYSAINRLIRWSARHKVRVTNIVGVLLSQVRMLYVPYDEMDDAGVKIPLDMHPNPVSHKDVPFLYYYKMARLRDRRVVLYSREKGNRLDGYENPAGLYLAFLAGSIRNSSIVLRSNRRKATIRKRYSSRWDYIPYASCESSSYAADWKTAAWSALSQRAPHLLKDFI